MNQRLASKQVFRNLMKSKQNIIILWIITILSSFMYFFVQCSIDGNIKLAFVKKYPELLTALRSNSILANTFLVCFIGILCFLYFMFYKRFFQSESRYMGCYETLGIKKNEILRIYVTFFFVILITAHAIGLGLGHYASDILISSYKTIYHLERLIRGIKLQSVLLGVLLPIGILLFFAWRVCGNYLKKPIYVLLNSNNEKKENVLSFANYISRLFKGEKAFGIRIAFRRPLSVVLLILSVFLFDLLFIFSISLNLSSKTVYDSQIKGRTYQYQYELSHIEEREVNQNSEFFLQLEMNIITKHKNFKQKVVGLQYEQGFFQLTEGAKTINEIPKDGVVINQRIHDVYHIDAGDELTLEIEGKQIKKTVKAISDNADLNSVYIDKKVLSDFAGYGNEAYNGIWCATKLENISGTMISMQEYKEQLDANNVSNRMSAVICQLLAIMIGCLLLFMAVLLNFETNLTNMIKLRILGYKGKEINRMLVNVYRPILIIGFFLTLYPCLFAGKLISNSLSLQTGDYMPFKADIFVIIFVFILINAVYTVIKLLFQFKIKKLFSSGQMDKLMLLLLG